MEQTTDRLSEALSQRSPVDYIWRESEPPDVMPADIVLVGDMDSPGPDLMTMVLSVEPERRCFLGALVTNELSLATADATILEPEETDLPYKIAVLTGLTGYFWFVQVNQRLGAVNEEILQAMIDVYTGAENEFQRSRRGVPLQYPRWDLRWPDLKAEAKILRKLEEDCREKREDDDIDIIYIHPALFHDLASGVITADKFGKLEATFSPSCIEHYFESLNISVLRAFPSLFSPKGSVNGLITKRANENQEDWLLRCTKEDGLANAPFVMIVGNSSSKPERVRYNGRRAEVLYKAVAV